MVDDCSPASDCPDHDVLLGYLRQALPEEEASSFEAHYFACDRCWEEVERGLEVRAALTAEETREVSSGEGQRAPGRWWRHPAFAVAAGLGLAAVGLWQWGPAGPEEGRETIVRGATEALELAFETSSERLALSWPEVTGAESYLVQFLDAAGTLLLEEETAASELTVAWMRLPPPNTEGALLARVQALDSLRQTLVSSDFVELPTRPE